MSAVHRSRHDVVVVGARVAGAATALGLARRGLDVLVLDREAPSLGTLSTHALMRGAVVALEALGVLDDVRATGTPPIERVTFQYGDDREVVDLTGRGALYAPRRRVLDALLVAAARDAGAEIRHRTAVVDLDRDPVTGRVRGVVYRDLDDPAAPPRTIAARHVVAADGRRSALAASLGAPVQQRGEASGAVAFRYVSDVPVDGYEWRYRPGRGAGVIPTDGGQVCVWTGVPTPRFLAERQVGVDAWFDRALQAAAPDVAARLRGRPAGRTWAFPGQPSLVRAPWGPGWALVGDAGAFRDPITSHGITDALRDALLLAEALGDVHEGVAEEVALRRFHRRRDRAMLPVLAVTEELAAYRWDLPQLRALLLELSDVMRAGTALLQGALPARAATRAA